MAVFRKAAEERAKLPQCVVDVPPSAWAQNYQDRPSEVVKIGLRLISEADASAARAAAAKKALRRHPTSEDADGQIEAYNGALMVAALGVSICQPDDINTTFREWTMPTEQLQVSFTSAGIEMLYGHLDMFTMGEAPSMPEANDEEIAAIATALLDGSAWKGMSGLSAHRVKRLLAACCNLMTIVEIENR